MISSAEKAVRDNIERKVEQDILDRRMYGEEQPGAGRMTVERYPRQQALPDLVVARGRAFTRDDLGIIAECVSRHYGQGRTFISKKICEALEWRQPNGWTKERACRDVLILLERRGYLDLPPSRKQEWFKKPSGSRKYRDCLLGYDLSTPITDCQNGLEIESVKGGNKEGIWNELVKRFHYLGYTTSVGRYIKFLVWCESRLIAALSFSSPAWRLKQREEWLAKIGVSQSDIDHLVINNGRFLILPHVQVPNLASKILSITTKRVVADWYSYYNIRPAVVETFVQDSRFDGTCYRAANWIEIGNTKGYAKRGAAHRNSQEQKSIFLYGLNRSIRRKLRTTLEKRSDDTI
jgi:hypothetical protein